jgi:hypothetical protein
MRTRTWWPNGRGKKWLQQRDKALRRDNYACQRCGRTKEELGYMQVHHVIPLYNFADTMKAHALSNLVCLCGSCHSFAEREVYRQRLLPLGMSVPSDEYEALLNELRVWCEPRGRKLELPRRLDVSPTLVTFWLRGERLLSLEQWLTIKKIIRPRRRTDQK